MNKVFRRRNGGHVNENKNDSRHREDQSETVQIGILSCVVLGVAVYMAGLIVSEQRFDRYTGRDMESRVEKLIMQMSKIEI
jgi:hypothetical protein